MRSEDRNPFGGQRLNRRLIMYVYIEPESGLWTVGFFDPDGKWIPESDHDNKEDAARQVHFLNGGNVE